LEEGKTFGLLPKTQSKRLCFTPTKKRNFRSLWIARINAGAREHGMSYSQFMGKVKSNNIELNRKVLADLAMNNPQAFKAVVDKIK
jgi:large subunit ribosomal protein L20